MILASISFKKGCILARLKLKRRTAGISMEKYIKWGVAAIAVFIAILAAIASVRPDRETQEWINNFEEGTEQLLKEQRQ